MKQRHATSSRDSARAHLRGWNVRIGQDFHTISTDQIEMVLRDADLRKYRKPPQANGSRARYFYALMQRRAQSKAEG